MTGNVNLQTGNKKKVITKEYRIWEEKIKDRKAELIKEITDFWENYAVKYQTYPEEYQRLLTIKRELGIFPLREICKSDLKDYPNIKLLKISDKEILLKTLVKMSVGDLAYNLEKCQEITINYVFNTIDSFIYDTNRQIEKTSSNYKKSELGPRPDLMHNTNLYAF